jgi:phosphoglycerate dehydrogenase-like enzyme
VTETAPTADGDPAAGGDPDVVVLRQTIHGQPAADYRDRVAERLPDREVVLARTPAEEAELLSSARVATGLSLTPEQLDAAPNLRLFACVYAGVGHLELDAFREHGVAVTNGSGVHAPNVSEYVVGWLIAQLRRFRRAWRQTDRGEWRKYPVRELSGSTVAVVGQGAIGTAVVERLAAFDAGTVAVRHTPGKGGPADAVFGYDDLHEALARADHLVCACPLTEETRGLIDGEAFRTLSPGTILVNVARGPVVDTDALVRAVQSEEIAGAVLDVTDPEPLPPDHVLWTLDPIAITPHNAGNTPHYYDRIAEILAENVERADESGFDGLRNQVV